MIISNTNKLPSVKICVFLLMEALKERVGEHLLRMVYPASVGGDELDNFFVLMPFWHCQGSFKLMEVTPWTFERILPLEWVGCG